ncbi:hypothetical protein BDZ91DRAFT_738806 [Kalaharituber pfeilii]|nr:hypothetical protein BDZ91DRAFT_738806 [Kalaharituber pfeilii]
MLVARRLLRRPAPPPFFRPTTASLRWSSTDTTNTPPTPSSKAEPPTPNVSASNESVPAFFDEHGAGAARGELTETAQRARSMQAPNRSTTWSSRQNPRELAMTGPRFEQTIMEAQPRPYAAIELIHAQPVRFVDQHVAVCDGGGGPAGHPKIYINVDKPEIIPCGYCGLPFAYSHHKKHLESLPSTEFPLE